MENTGSASCPFCEWYYGSAVWRRSCAQNILWAILAAVQLRFDPLNDCPICGTKLEGGVSV